MCVCFCVSCEREVLFVCELSWVHSQNGHNNSEHFNSIKKDTNRRTKGKISVWLELDGLKEGMSRLTRRSFDQPLHNHAKLENKQTFKWMKNASNSTGWFLSIFLFSISMNYRKIYFWAKLIQVSVPRVRQQPHPHQIRPLSCLVQHLQRDKGVDRDRRREVNENVNYPCRAHQWKRSGWKHFVV